MHLLFDKSYFSPTSLSVNFKHLFYKKLEYPVFNKPNFNNQLIIENFIDFIIIIQHKYHTKYLLDFAFVR